MSATTHKLVPRLQRQIVDYASKEAAGTVIIDTPHTFLYYVLGNGKAMRYGIGVGREGFTWSGVRSVERKAEWPDWYPPAEMLSRQPYLPRMTAGGPGNPLGARAMYIAGTQYRIHGTNAPSTIGKHVSSGCIRLTNDDVIDLFSRVQVGAKVIVLPQTAVAQSQASVAGERLCATAEKPRTGDLGNHPAFQPLVIFRKPPMNGPASCRVIFLSLAVGVRAATDLSPSPEVAARKRGPRRATATADHPSRLVSLAP